MLELNEFYNGDVAAEVGMVDAWRDYLNVSLDQSRVHRK